ncbi:hypothetical protein RA11412_1576 [Rothia aeria]|uniref:Uncharacterized protein n=1 Tax=Rothia aeria TaxID=172042 RepID=A0A2Z5QZF1_9MICC|nr:hypothetical protein RA11412_1576 [Rothia aeria]
MVFPAYVGMSPQWARQKNFLPVFPAYVGMSPFNETGFSDDLGVPRIRGDEPTSKPSTGNP